MTLPLVIALIIWVVVIPAFVLTVGWVRASALRAPSPRADYRPRRRSTNGMVRNRIFTSSQRDQLAPYGT